MDGKAHWEDVYRTKAPDRVSWFQSEPRPSLEALARHGAGPDRALIDIGGGASTLAAELARKGWHDLAVLDISAAALEVAKAAYDGPAGTVDWIVADITTWQPQRAYDVWHDRAVFHFMTNDAACAGYLRALEAGLKPGGLLVMATFAPDGPEKCSGLPVQRYSPDTLAARLGVRYALLEAWREEHATPAGAHQAFTWCVFRRQD